MTAYGSIRLRFHGAVLAGAFLIALTGAWPLVPVAGAVPWLPGYNNRVFITIDHNDIISDLTNFPVLIYLSTSSGRNDDDVSYVFDEIANDANRKKISVVSGDPPTACYVEIEKWDNANEQAWLWVNVPVISSSESTTLTLYFDRWHPDNTTTVGDPDSSVAENVWDEHFKYVSHMQDDPDSAHIRDSTENDNDGTKAGAGEPAVTTNGTTGAAQGFDGGNDEINSAANVGISLDTPRSVSARVKSDRIAPAENYLLGWGSGFNNALFSILMYNDGTWGVDGFGSVNAWHTEHVPTNTWSHIFVTYDGSQVEFYLNNVRSGTGWAHTFSTMDTHLKIGNIITWNARRWHGVIDELRISNTNRSPAWIQAAYESEKDDLLTFGQQESIPGEGLFLMVK